MFQISRRVAKLSAFVLVMATLGLASPLLPSAQATGTVPGAPDNVAVATAGATATSLDVSWSAPMSDGGSAITDYKVEYRNFTEFGWSEFSHPASPDTSITVTGLNPDSRYQFRISAINGVGTGPFQEAVDQVDSGGWYHVCAVVTGTVQCWGRNADGQLGNNSTAASSVPVVVSGVNGLTPDTTAVSVSGGLGHSCAAMSSGIVKCWGSNSDGQLGNNSNIKSLIPVNVANIDGLTPATKAVSVSLHQYRSCALMANGTVKCWGDYQRVPADVSGFSDATPATTAIAISVGDWHACALMANGAARCWGLGSSGQLGNNSFTGSNSAIVVTNIDGSETTKTAVSVSAGNDFTCAAMADGIAKCWGKNNFSQLGNNLVANSSVPGTVTGIDGITTSTSAVNVSVGTAHACAVMIDGSAKCWGSNSSGQLGNRSITNSGVPVSVFGFTGASPENSAIAVTAGYANTCALMADSSATCWGWGVEGVLGNDSTSANSVPVQVAFNFSYGQTLPTPALPRAPRDVATSNATALSVDLSWSAPVSDGGLAITDYKVEYRQSTDVSWLEFSHAVSASTTITVTGLNPDSDYEFRVSAVNSAGTGPWREVAKTISASGWYNFCSVMGDGTVRCWGSNNNGQLGDNSTIARPAPVTVVGIDGSTPATTAVDVSSGAMWHTCALMADATVKCWGLNDYGQLGNNSTVNSLVPVPVANIDGTSPGRTAVSVSTGTYWSCALMANGTVRCWGDKFYVGSSNFANVLVPLAVSNVSGLTSSSGAVELTSAGKNGCVRMADGTVQCWGEGLNGSLGNIAYPNGSQSPVLVSTIDGATSASTAVSVTRGIYEFGCSLMANGTVKCWGWNSSGQLGDGSTINKSAPVLVSNIDGTEPATTAVGVSGGGNHACAVMENNSVRCWGANFSVGLLGNDSTINSSIPVAVSQITGATSGTSAVDVAAGYLASCALMSDGGVRCWGSGGMLGDNTSSGSPIPTRVAFEFASARTLSVPAPDAPGVPTAVAGDGQATVTVVPAAGGTSPTSYTISVAGDPTKFCTVTNPAVSLSCVVPGLSNGTSYTFVVAANAYGLSSDPSSASAPVTPVAPPRAPGAPTVVAGNGQVTVTVVRAVGGTPATSYTISVVGLPGKSCSVPNPEVSLSCVVSGLTNGTAYKFIAVASANGISSANSAHSASATPRAPAAVPPGKPLNVVITDRSAQTLELSWDAPASPGSSAITGYTVAWREVGTGWIAGNTKSATSRNATVTGLTAGKSYEIRVSATNATLTGAWSASATGIVPAKAAAPQNVKGTAVGLKITLTWTKVTTPSHSPVLKYSMYCAVGLENPARAQVGPTISTATLTVTQRKLYVCRVAAVTAAGRGTDSAPVRVSIK